MNDSYATLVALGVQTLLYLLGGYALVIRSDTRITNLSQQMEAITEELKELAKVVTIQAVQTEKIENLQTQVVMLQRNYEDLRRGVGWVGSSRGGVNGEYP